MEMQRMKESFGKFDTDLYTYYQELKALVNETIQPDTGPKTTERLRE